MRQPAFWSRAFDDIPEPDFADVIIGVLPAGASTDPAVWAATVFSAAGSPAWVRAAMGLLQSIAPLIGVRHASRAVFRIDSVVHDEALIAANDKHLDMRIGVGVDPVARLVRIVTAVRLHGRHGRLYFAPVRLAHPAVVGAMLRRSAKLLSAAPELAAPHGS